MMKKSHFKAIFIFLFTIYVCNINAQTQDKLSFFTPADTFHKTRFWGSAITGVALSTGMIVSLSQIWYAKYPRSRFHTFDDRGEWEDIDKMGHFNAAWMQSNFAFKGALWTGLKRKKAMWLGYGLGMVFQASIEILDGFSEEWGFSIPDIALNTLGSTFFLGQELLWQEQRIVMKVSSSFPRYPDYTLYSVDGNEFTDLKTRAHQLYGSGYVETFFKDYNQQTNWASINIHSFIPNKETTFPKWLNVAVGYGANNMYGGYINSWVENGISYALDKELFPRYRQFYLSLDVDLTRIKTKSPFLKTLFSLFNIIKIPAPTLEYNTLGQVKFHALYF